MGTKEIKVILKEVREEIKNEKYDAAIEKCEKLLKLEPENYMAHLLLGAAYQNGNKTQAAKYLRKAVEYSPAAPTVALQGLANCAPVEELPKIYEQLLELLPEKFSDYYEKLFQTTSNSNAALECFTIFKRETKKTYAEERQKAILRQLAKIWLTKDYEAAGDEEELYKSVLESTIEDPELEVHLTALKRYLKLLYNQGDIVKCIKYACATIEQYPDDNYAYAWICKIYCDHYNSKTDTASNTPWECELKEPLTHYASTLLNLNENASLALLVKAIELYKQQQFLAARDLLYKALKLQPDYEATVELLARVEMHLGAYGLALPLCQQLSKLSEEYAICLAHSKETKDLKDAVPLLLSATHTDEVLSALARCYFHLNERDKLVELQLNDLSRAEYILSPIEAIELLKSHPDLESFSSLLLLGALHLKLGNYAEALTCLMKATRLQPYRSECFFYLGKVYYASADIVRTRKCFEKCININPLCEEAVNNLSAIYQQLGEEELNEALLLNTLKYMKSESSKRVHFKLGLHYLNIKKWDDAIHAFRTAIKFDVTCMTYWESLGDAYATRGSYNSAIRVFQKLLEMDAGNVYAKLQIALIKTTIRMYPEAIEDFDNLLKDDQNYLPGLKGAAEAHLGLAHNLKLEHRYGRCKAHLQFAVNYLQRAFFIRDNQAMVWLWRLAANVFLQTARMPTSMANLEVAGKLAQRDTETAILSRKDLLNLAVRFYTCALKLKENTYLWYELALCCYYSADYLPEEAATHLELATKACKMSIQEQSNRWQNWNLLGVINMHKNVDNLPLAQHCFIQALTLDRKSFTTWTNLGVLYLKLKEIKLANQAFQRAQQSSPMYPNAWIGQAMIAETICEEEESLDLFRHCQQFEFHAESALGYAHWVCAILSDDHKCRQPRYKHAIENMYADVVALDAINWYTLTEEDATSVAGLSFQGFLNVRQKLYHPAVKAYLQASEKAAAGAERDKILTNLGHLYLKLNKPNEAIGAFNMVTQATFKPIMGLALAYFRADQHQEAYSLYNSVLKSVAGAEDDKSAKVLVFMAAMVYAFQGEADTKTILYQCILLKNPPIQALYSACALGILHKDNQLTETILTELKKYENCEKYCAHIAYLTAQYYLANDQPHKALKYIASRVHIYPQCAELRKVLAHFLLDNYGKQRKYVMSTCQIALSTIALVHSSRSKKSDCVEDAKSLLVASRALHSVDKQRSLKLLQSAIHLYPENKEAWKALQQIRCE